MIFDNEKQKAWMALGECVALGQVRWRDRLSQEQIDYLLTCINKKSFPGEGGRKLRAISRWNHLDYAFEIFKAQQPDRSDRKTYEAVAKHYDCGWPTVRKARQEMLKQEFSFAGRHRQLGFTDEDFAQLALPHINFDNFPDEQY